MVTVVVPHRRRDAKRRLDVDGRLHAALVEAMLTDVLDAAAPLGRVVVADAPGGQGSAVMRALEEVSADRILIVNSDLPCVTTDDLRALLGAVPEGGLAVAPGSDGTTNALGLSHARLFRPLYGAGSAARFRALARSVTVTLPNLVDDVDTLDDLRRLGHRLGSRTRAAAALAA